MRRKLIAVLLSVALLASAVLCVGAALFTDTEGHWAEYYINEATSRGLFSGVEDGSRFAPDDEMTRAMFVTVLGRMAGVEPADYDTDFLANVFDDVNSNAYYAPYVSWAVTVGVASGIGNNLFAPDQAVSREQMACFVSNFLTVAGYDLSVPARQDGELPAQYIRPEFVPTPREDINGDDLILPPDVFPDDEEENPEPEEFDDEPYFSDDAQIADWAKKSVAQMQHIGLLSGVDDGNGGYAFLPKKVATRAECAVVFVKQQDYLNNSIPAERIEAETLLLNCDSAEVEAGASIQLSAVVFPMDADNQNVLWYSTDRTVLTVDAMGCVTGVKEGEAEVRARMANNAEVVCAVKVTPAPVPEYLTSPAQVYAPTSWYDKCMKIFGTLWQDPRLAYSCAEEALPHMTVVVVPAWDIDETTGEKYTKFYNLQVHENVADVVKCIFEEIYALPEQVPIHSLGGYRWDGKCEHSIGLAIDINPAENYYCKNDGTAVVGKYFKPGEDPYSIPVEGAVDQIFAKYGFTRGIYWHSGYKDYMHYSYFGT